jgi:hypothetical protein
MFALMPFSVLLPIFSCYQVSNHLPILENNNGDESNPEILSSPPALEEDHSSHCLETLPDVSQTESVDIFMEVSESVHEEPSTENTKLASNL